MYDCLAVPSSFWELGEGSNGCKEKARRLCGSLPAQLLRHLQNKEEKKYPEREPTSNPTIPSIEHTHPDMPRSICVRKPKIFRSPRTCKPPCAAKLWQWLWPLPLAYAAFAPQDKREKLPTAADRRKIYHLKAFGGKYQLIFLHKQIFYINTFVLRS